MQKQTWQSYRVLLFMVALLWIIEIINYFLAHQLNQFGLVPRELAHLPGILTMHFLHGGFNHLVSNSVPLLVLGFLVALNQKLLPVTLSIALLTGTCLWIVARSGMHVGASGIVMGYFGYLISVAFFQKDGKSILLTLATVVIYGGLMFTLLDFRGWVSFEGHIIGFASGILSARVWHWKSVAR